MWKFLIISLGTIHILRCSDLTSADDSRSSSSYESVEEQTDISEEQKFTTVIDNNTQESTASTIAQAQRRYWLVTSNIDVPKVLEHRAEDENDKDANLKSKITTLVEQTLHDTERKLKSIKRLKEKHKLEPEYKVGFILSMVKKSKDVLNELFNVAVKHRDDYKALEQLKIFEFIVHTNVDTTNLVRQMVEIHIEHVNSTNSVQQRNRVVLL